MNCTRCLSDGALPRREHAERVMCDGCAAKPPIVDWEHPPAAPELALLVAEVNGHGAFDKESLSNRPAENAYARYERLRSERTRRVDWLDGQPMDPAAVPPEPAPTVPGFPYLPEGGGGAVIVGPTGGGRSSLLQACAYDAGRAGVKVAVLSGEITAHEFNARAADLADRRGDHIDDELRGQLERVRFLDLATVIHAAWDDPEQWVREIAERFQVLAIDPLSTVASALDLDFDKSNADFVSFYDRLVQPLVAHGVWTVMAENIGHAVEARSRAKGASAKSDRADLTFSCSLQPQPLGLVLTARKVRSVRAPFSRGAEWVFLRDTQSIEAHTDAASSFRPTVLMDRILEAVTADPGIGVRDLRAAVKGKNDAKRDALRILIEEGQIVPVQDGPAIRHYSAGRAPASTETAGCAPLGVPPVPPRAPTVPPVCPDECAPVPPSLQDGARGHTSDDEARAERLIANHPEAN